MAFDMKDYVEVADRIQEWYETHPEGRIITEITELTDARVTVRALVYRVDGIQVAPAGVGHSFMNIPGTTSFTKGSELENAETSAVGRALVMAGLRSKRVASADEVRAKRDGEERRTAKAGEKGKPQPATPDGTSPSQPTLDAGCKHSELIEARKQGWLQCLACGLAKAADKWDS